MKTNNYQRAKQELKQRKEELKGVKDKPMIRESLNNLCDGLIRFGGLTDYQAILLDNYCCKLHPK